MFATAFPYANYTNLMLKNMEQIFSLSAGKAAGRVWAGCCGQILLYMHLAAEGTQGPHAGEHMQQDGRQRRGPHRRWLPLPSWAVEHRRGLGLAVQHAQDVSCRWGLETYGGNRAHGRVSRWRQRSPETHRGASCAAPDEMKVCRGGKAWLVRLLSGLFFLSDASVDL